MPLFHMGPAGDAFAGAFGGVAALLLLGGPIALRWQRNRQRFELTKTALAQGVTTFPKGQPFWLVSMRAGVVTLALGIALLVAGLVGSAWTWHLPLPASASGPAEPPTVREVDRVAPSALRPAPPAPNPALEEWHRLKAANSLAMMGVAAGCVLVVVGAARIGFAKTERCHEPPTT